MPRKRTDAPGQTVLDFSQRVTLDLPPGAQVQVTIPATTAPVTGNVLAEAARRLMEAPNDMLHTALIGQVDLVRLNERVHGVLYHAYNRAMKRSRF